MVYASLLLLPISGGFVAVGFVAQGEAFDWNVASVFGTAVGTTLLAIATLAVAYSTWQDVRASQQIALETAATG